MFYISVVLIIIGTISYDLLEKTLPKKENPYLYLLSTYATALIILFLLLIINKYNFNNLISDINIQSLLVGIAAMFVDYGLILSYKKGWKISTLNITYTSFVLFILLLIGFFFFKEKIDLIELIGILLCFTSVFLINYKKSSRVVRG